MELTATEGRVLGCLIEQQLAVVDSAGASLDELRFACNRTTGRDPVVAYDDRAVEDALLSLKSKGLARFGATGRDHVPALYRHRADERWRLNRFELGALAILMLRGPQTTDQVRKALVGESSAQDAAQVEAALDALAGRTPTPLATRMVGRNGETLWVEVLTDRLATLGPEGSQAAAPPRPLGQVPLPGSDASPAPGPQGPTLADVADRLTKIERRLAAIEAALSGVRSAPRPDPSRVRR